MGKETAIQWTDSTVNPVMGCAGCEIWTSKRRTCYAGQLHKLRTGHPGYAANFDVPEEFPGRMAATAKWSDLTGKERPDKPWMNGMPRCIFVSDMGDALSQSIPFEFLKKEIIDVVTTGGSKHIYQWLTKQARRMLAFSAHIRDLGIDWPENLWAMTSVTGKATTGRVWDLRKVGNDHTTRGISFEPLDDEPDWDRIFGETSGMKPLHWAIFGGESGTQAPECLMQMFERGIAAARKHGVAPFLKQLGRRPVTQLTVGSRPTAYKISDSHGGDWGEWPEEYRVRQMPRRA